MPVFFVILSFAFMDKLSLKSNIKEGRTAKALRRAGRLPGIVYGRGNTPVSVDLDRVEFEKAYRDAGTSQIVLLDIEGAGKKNVLIHEVDFEPVNGQPIHVDFYEISMKEKITTEVPLSFTGDSVAIIEMSGTLVTNRDNVEVECLPADLPHQIEVDIAALTDFDASIQVKDIKLPEGVEIKNEEDEVIAFVEAPRSEEEMAELEEPVEEPETPESEQGGEESPGENPEESKE